MHKMFCKATLLTVALGVMASASPVAQNADGNLILLPKRASLTNADGTFDHESAIVQSVMTRNKHRQNLINLEKNVGLKLDMEIKPLAQVPNNTLVALEKRQKESLTDNDDLNWSGTISIGTPAQTFVVDFDTGSSDLWVTSSSCKSSTCASKDKYEASSSSTSSKKSGTFEIGYADGSSVSGPIYTDTVTVGNVTATSQYFSPVTALSSSFADIPVDGILGMAFPAISNMHEEPWFNNAHSQGAVSSNVFGFKLASSGSELYIGGTDASLYTGSIEYHSIDTSAGFWLATDCNALVGSTTASSGFDTIIDSGTTIMYGPTSAVKTFYSKVSGSKVYDPENGYYSFPCDNIPSVSFSWGGKNWAVSSTNFNLGETESGSGECVGALSGQALGLGNNVWVLGDSFLKNVYAAFDVGNNQIGFAALA